LTHERLHIEVKLRASHAAFTVWPGTTAKAGNRRPIPSPAHQADPVSETNPMRLRNENGCVVSRYPHP
jgi:hypothetical protein